MFHSLRRSLSNLPLKNKIFLLLLIVILPIFFAFLLGLHEIDDIYCDYLYESVAERLTYSGQEISSKLQTVEHISQLMLSNEAIQSNLYTLNHSRDPQLRSAASTELRVLLNDYADTFRGSNIRSIDLYCLGFSTSSDPYRSKLVPSTIFQDIRMDAIRGDGAPVWVPEHASAYGLFLGREVRQMEHLSLAPLGELVINVDLDTMLSQTADSGNGDNFYAYLLMRGDDVVYRSALLSEEQARDVQHSVSGNYKIIDIGGKKYFSVFRGLPYYGWDYICLLPYDNVMTALAQAQTYLIAAIGLCVLLMLLVAFHVIDSITRHFQRLVGKMLMLGGEKPDGPWEEYDYSDRKDEIGILHQQFDQMVLRLEHLIETNYINELMKKEAQLQALENQINPHFLYNTLESINWRAKALGATDISEMVQALAALLRVTLNKNSAGFSLKEELDLIRSYMVIQQYRFDDRLQYTIEVEPGAASMPIPKLILQPIVENAVHYGLENNIDGCIIRITAEIQDQQLLIRVYNTGSAMEDDLLHKLRCQEVDFQGHGIALLNIEERLKLTYGEAARLNLYNQDDWAVAEIALPLKEEPLC